MRITVNTNQLQDAIKKGQKAISKSYPLAIIENLLLRAEHDRITITAVNRDFRETVLTIEVNGSIEEVGSTLLNIPTLKLIAKIKNEDRLTITEEAITTKKRTINFKSLLVEDFPQVERKCNTEAFTTNQKELLELLSIDYAMSNDVDRPVFCGILIDKNHFVSCDTHRLAVREFKFNNSLEKPFILNYVVIDLLKKQLLNKKSESAVKVFISEDQEYLTISFDNITITTKEIDHTFPKWQQLIPQNFSTTITVNNKEIQEEIDFLKESAKNLNNAIVFKIMDGKVFIKSKDDFNMINVEIPATITGDELPQVAFNYKFLLDSLKANKSEEVKFSFTGGLSPMVLENDLILPVRVA